MPNREPAFLHHPHQAAGMFGSLQEAYDRLDAIIESSYDGILITDGQAVTILAEGPDEAQAVCTLSKMLGA